MTQQLTPEEFAYVRARAFPEAAPVEKAAPEPVMLLWKAYKALTLAGAICDAVPNRDPGHLGKLVNVQPDGSCGYRQIHDAADALREYLTEPTAAQQAAQPVPDHFPDAGQMVAAQSATMTGDDACRFSLWWNHKRATFTTPRQAAWAAWGEALSVPQAAQPVANAAGNLSPYDAVARAMDMASMLAGAVGMNDRAKADAIAARLRSHLFEYIKPQAAQPVDDRRVIAVPNFDGTFKPFVPLQAVQPVAGEPAEPLGWRVEWPGEGSQTWHQVFINEADALDKKLKHPGAMCYPLYTAAPAQVGLVPLTEAQLVECLVAAGCIGTVRMSYDSGPYEITRTSINADRLASAIEAKLCEVNGIKAGKDVAK